MSKYAVQLFSLAQKQFDEKYQRFQHGEDGRMWRDDECFDEYMTLEFVEKHIGAINHEILSPKFLRVLSEVEKKNLHDFSNISKYLIKILSEQCEYVFQRGRNAGERCPHKKFEELDFCDRHLRKGEKEEYLLSKLQE